MKIAPKIGLICYGRNRSKSTPQFNAEK